jgi:hypothetical protein
MSSGGHHEVATRAGRVKSRVWEESYIIIHAAVNLLLFCFCNNCNIVTIVILIPSFGKG